MDILNKNKTFDEGKIQLSTIRRVWHLIARNWYIVAIVLAVSLGFYIYEAVTTSVTGALAKMQIALKYNESNMKDYSDYSGEMTGINSRDLLSQTIDKLDMGVSCFTMQDGKYRELQDSIPFKVDIALVSPELEESYIKLSVLNAREFELSYEKGKEHVIKRCFFDSAVVNTDIKFHVDRIVSPDSTFDTYTHSAYFIQVHNKLSLLERCQSLIGTKLTKDLAVLEVTYRDMIPARAVSFLDTLAKAYLNKTIYSQMERNSKMVTGIDRLLLGTNDLLNNIEDSLRVNHQNGGAISENIEEQKYLSALTNLMLDKRKIEFQRIGLEDVEKYILENKNNPGLPPPPFFGIGDDVFLKTSLAELYTMQVTKKDYQFDMTEKSRGINKIDYTYETKKKDLLEYIKNAKVSVDAKIVYLKKLISDEDEPSRYGYSKAQLNLLSFKRQMKVNEAMYMNLLERKNNLLVAQAAMAPEYKIFESAHIIEYGRTYDKSRVIWYLLGGLAIALLLIYLKNFFFENIESLEFLKSKTSIPVLGEMAFVKTEKGFMGSMIDIHKHPIGSALLSSLRTNIEFKLGDLKSKVILITSHTSAEGKTFNAVNLGAILAKTNKRILLLDMDFHKPNLGNVLGLNDCEISMEEVYKRKFSIADAIIRTKIKHLDAIITLRSLEDASENILHETTREIIEYGRKNYDYVIIDTPPVGIISDALCLMKYSDLNIYVLNAITAYKNALTQMEDIVENHKFKIHVVLNKVRIKRLQYYSRYYENYRYMKVS